MRETIYFKLSDTVTLSIQSGDCRTIDECVADINPVLETIRKQRSPMTKRHIDYLTRIGSDIMSGE